MKNSEAIFGVFACFITSKNVNGENIYAILPYCMVENFVILYKISGECSQFERPLF